MTPLFFAGCVRTSVESRVSAGPANEFLKFKMGRWTGKSDVPFVDTSASLMESGVETPKNSEFLGLH